MLTLEAFEGIVSVRRSRGIHIDVAGNANEVFTISPRAAILVEDVDTGGEVVEDFPTTPPVQRPFEMVLGGVDETDRLSEGGVREQDFTVATNFETCAN